VYRARLVISAFLILTIAALVGGQDPKQEGKKFDLKLEKDKKFYQKMYTEVSQVIKVMGQDLTQKQESTFFSKWTPVKQEGDKWELTDEIEGLIMSIDISGNKITYDSTVSDGGATAGNPGLMDFFKKLIGSKFTVILDKNCKVEKVTGVEEFRTSIGAGSSNPQMNTLLQNIMTDDAVKQMFDPTFGLMPDSPKKAGEKWSKSTTLNLGPIGSYAVTYNFTFVGPDKDMDKIEVETTLVYTAPKGDPAAGGLLFRIKDGKLQSENPAKGVILYNPKLQRIDSADISIRMKGELTVTIGMTDTKVELLQTQTTKINTSDTSLLPVKK
jgi:hypothetical protein